MEKENNSQLELFSRINEDSQAPSARTQTFSWQIRNHEKKLLLGIIIIIIMVVSFSLGVERGKRIVLQRDALPANSVTAEKQQKSVLPPVISPATQEKQLTAVKKNDLLAQKSESALQLKETNAALQAPGRYAIQVASFKNRASAENESRNLKKKGYSTIVLAKGKYAVLCVGSFKDKESAKKVLSELKKRYQDCFIRRM